MNDILHIGFDKGEENGDTSVLSVLRKTDKNIFYLNFFTGEEAERLYKKLVEKAR